jgi:DNA polymerase III sliding clamp (beta) subunit (PCNA family)
MIEIEQADLQAACAVLDKIVVDKGSTNVYHGMILLEVDANGIDLTATNGAIASSVRIPSDGSSLAGTSLCVTGKFFSRLVRSLEGKFTLDVEGFSISLKQEDGSSFAVQGSDSDLFPRMPRQSAGYDFSEVSADVLLDALSGVTWTADSKGLRLKITEDTLETSAIAGSSRAAIYKSHLEPATPFEAVLPLDTSKVLIEGLKQADCEIVKIGSSASTLEVVAGNVSFSSRLLSQMPDVSRLFSVMNQWTMQAECDRKDLIAAIAPIAVYAQSQEREEDRPVIRLHFRDGGLSLKDGRYKNLAEKVIPVDFEGDYAIAFDHTLLTSLLKTMKSDDRVVFHLKEKSPAFITYPSGGHTSQMTLLAPITII